MELAKPGEIKNKCLPNALLSYEEYLLDYASPELKASGEALINSSLADIPQTEIREFAQKSLQEIRQGKRDLFC